MASFQIDSVEMTNKPSHVSVIYPEPVVYPLAGAGKIIVLPETPPRIEVRWGIDAAKKAVVAELKTKRGSTPIHTIVWTSEDGVGTYWANVFMPQIPNAYGPSFTAVDVFTLVMEALEPIVDGVVYQPSATQSVTVSESASASVQGAATLSASATQSVTVSESASAAVV